MNKIVALDMDDVLYNSRAFAMTCEKHNIDPKTCYDWHMRNVSPEFRNDVQSLWRSEEIMCDSSRYLPDAIDFVQILEMIGLEVVIVSAAFEEIAQARIKHVRESLDCACFITTLEKKSKLEICQSIGAVMMVDDNIENLLPFIGQKEILPILFSNEETLWNHNHPRRSELLIVSDYAGLLKHVLSFIQKQDELSQNCHLRKSGFIR
jgi:hypothetical protein